jgi:hypothetical protein
MESWIYQQGRTEGVMQGRAEGLVKGQLAEAREMCRRAVHKWHPRAGIKM